MVKALRVVIVASVVACMSVAAGAEEPTVTTNDLLPGEKVAIEPDRLDDVAAFKILLGGSEITIKVNPDGYIQIYGATMRAVVAVRNNLGNRVTFDMKQEEAMSVWPIERMEIIGGSAEFVLKIDSSDWAYVVRADHVGPAGMKVRCDNMTCTLRTGERLDTDRVDDKVSFRRVGRSWPGTLVEDLTSPTRTPVATPGLPEDSLGDDTLSGAPGVLSDRNNDFPWQTVALPTISWDVFRPADVSP